MNKVIRYLFSVAAFLLVIPCAQVLGADQAKDSSIEIEFWQSVKDSDNPDMLRAYLEEFPNGKFKALAEIKLSQLNDTKKAEYFWCARKNSVVKHTRKSCDALGGQTFRDKDAALDEKKRLNAETPTASMQAESNASEASMEDSLPKTNWCGDSSGSYEASATECIGKNGIPTRTKSDAQWITQNYFGQYEDHKAFAISDGGFGLAAYRPNPEVAKKRALLSCNMRAINARTCRVVNIDGRATNFVNFQQSSKPVFSARGQQQDLTGRYHLRLRSAGMDATLMLEGAPGTIGGSIKICWDASRCAKYQIKKIFEQNRGRYFRSSLYLKHNPGARWPEGWQLSASFSSDTTLVIGEVGPHIFDGEKYSE